MYLFQVFKCLCLFIVDIPGAACILNILTLTITNMLFIFIHKATGHAASTQVVSYKDGQLIVLVP